MKKLIFGILLLLAATFGAGHVSALNPDDYTITSYGVQMTLDKDTEGRSRLTAKETIVAQFSDNSQTHGLERILVDTYDGHSTHLEIVSVEDFNRQPLNYTFANGRLRVGDASSYAHGTQTYVITYTQHDVTRYFSDTNKDEFYWDVIGTDWRVPIEQATVQIDFAKNLPNDAKQRVSCYKGALGSTTACDSVEPGLVESTVLLHANNLSAGEGMTVAVGFDSGTFAGYKASLFEQVLAVWGMVQAGLFVIGVAVITWIFVRWNSLTGRKKEIGTIVPEYIPPKDTSVTTSAQIGGYRIGVMTAQLLDLAVRHYIKIYEVKEKTFFSPAEYEIEIIKEVDGLKWEEQELLRDTFGSLPTSVGQRLNLKTLKNNTSYYMRTLNNDKDLDALIKGSYGLKEKDDTIVRWARRTAAILGIASILLLSPVLLFVTLIAFVLSFVPWRLTDAGLALKRYLEGLKLYIKVAETDRIKMLQSPDGVEKVGVTVTGSDNTQLLKLYERVLPYAVLFGQEKQWNQQIGKYYEASGTQPDWYAGQSGVFNAVAFSSAMNSFSSASTAASSYSSSSGGSGGGGFSGGGGGGGGGGGW